MLHSEDSAVGYYRIWQPAKYLEKRGWEIARLEKSFRKVNIEGDEGFEGLAKGSDILVVQRPEAVENVALFMAMRDVFDIPMVFEIDDNVYDVAETSHAYQYWQKDSPRIKVVNLLINNADAVTVTTNALREAYAPLNDNIFVLPNCQEPDNWKVKPAKPHEGFVLGWAGSSTHYDDLKMIWQPIKKFLRNHKDAKFKVIGAKCDFLLDHPQVEISTEWKDVYEYPQYLTDLGFDVGIIPVVNRPFNLGKSNIKWQEYSMAGIPTIASNLGEYKTIQHGETGLLAIDNDSWYYSLNKLYDDKKLRKTLSEQAKQYVLNNFNINKEVENWDRTYRTIIEQYKSGKNRTKIRSTAEDFI